ncbi:cytochrome P450 family 71 polypeptide [Rhynchospora pubera]|uniref:Cytochrome P450 family 71 polypeptide n=1 Tax=Rhynchospora pubera TaxID=906938 RepID=A0AAV8GUB7_9POAL|nr:cytochrome P450 family 71 polypeptide [Rhynchospora pubera]
MAAFNYLFFILVLPLLLLFLKTKRESKNSYRLLPPGPWTLPIIGSLHHLTGTDLPHRKLRIMSRRYGDLMFLQLGEQPTVIASSREAVKEITKTHDLKFCTRAVNLTSRVLSYDMKDVVFAPYGEYWREIRKMCVSELLSFKRVQSFKSIREEKIRSLTSGSHHHHPKERLSN